MKWLYGNAWEKFPIEEGESWGIPANGSRVAVHDIFNPLPQFMMDADLIFSDPPWNLGNVNSFYTKAERDDYPSSFSIFEDVLFERLRQINPRTLYLEVGFQAVERWQKMLDGMYPCVQRWQTTYYRKHRCYVLRGGHASIAYDFDGIDEAKVIEIVGKIEDYQTMGDLCMGTGLVGLSAFAAGRRFVGTELNKRRLAMLLDKLASKGADVQKFA